MPIFVGKLPCVFFVIVFSLVLRDVVVAGGHRHLGHRLPPAGAGKQAGPAINSNFKKNNLIINWETALPEPLLPEPLVGVALVP